MAKACVLSPASRVTEKVGGGKPLESLSPLGVWTEGTAPGRRGIERAGPSRRYRRTLGSIAIQFVVQYRSLTEHVKARSSRAGQDRYARCRFLARSTTRLRHQGSEYGRSGNGGIETTSLWPISRAERALNAVGDREPGPFRPNGGSGGPASGSATKDRRPTNR